MNGSQCCVLLLALLILVLPWCVATVLTWIYTSSSTGSRDNPLGSTGGKIISIAQTSSAVVYVSYIFFAVTCIGFAGRRSILSYCCLVMGVPVFVVVPVTVGGTMLVVALLSFSKNHVGAGIGIAAAVFCLLSTAICLVMTLWALICGSRGKGKNHRYPIPLAYLPLLRDFEQGRTEVEVRDIDRYTEDYPSPLHSFRDHKSDHFAIPPKSCERRLSHVSSKQDKSGQKASVTSSGGVSKDQKVSAVSSNGKSYSSSTINTERKVPVNTQPTSDSRKFSVQSTTSFKKTSSGEASKDRKVSAVYDKSSSFSATSTERKVSVNTQPTSDSRKFSVQSTTSSRASVTSSGGASKDRKVSALSSNDESSSSAINTKRKVSVNTRPTSDSRKFSVHSTTSLTNAEGRKFSVHSTTSLTNAAGRKHSVSKATHKLSEESLASRSRNRNCSVDSSYSRRFSTDSSAGPMKVLPYKYSIGSCPTKGTGSESHFTEE